MAFNGCYFSFDGIPCTEYGLMMYEFGASGSSNGTVTPNLKIVEDRVSNRYTPLHYGVIQNEPLTFNLTFGVNPESIENGKPLDRWDIDVIARWLTGHRDYKWLEISQPDMETVRYRCFITNLKYVDYGMFQWGFTCTVLCDSPFAYMYPETYTYQIRGNSEFTFYNKSAYHGYYRPKIIITHSSGGTFQIINHSDNDWTMQFTSLPSTNKVITVDNENEIITCLALPNPYSNFNFHFFRLVQGKNELEVNGTGTLQILCEFPVNVGG